MGSETKAHPQRWDNFGNRRSAMDRAGKYLTLPYPAHWSVSLFSPSKYPILWFLSSQRSLSHTTSIQTTVSLRVPCQRLYNPQFLLVLQEIAVLKVLNISENQAAKSSQSQVYRPISLIHLRQQMVRNIRRLSCISQMSMGLFTSMLNYCRISMLRMVCSHCLMIPAVIAFFTCNLIWLFSPLPPRFYCPWDWLFFRRRNQLACGWRGLWQTCMDHQIQAISYRGFSEVAQGSQANLW